MEKCIDQIVSKEYAPDRMKWHNGVYELSRKAVNSVTFVKRDKTEFKIMHFSFQGTVAYDYVICLASFS